MISRLIVVAAVAQVAAYETTPIENQQCLHISEDGYTYDLAPMERITGDLDFSMVINEGKGVEWQYRLNICHDTLSPCQGTPGAVVETVHLPAGESCRVLGRIDDFEKSDLKYPVTADNPHGEGVRIIYKDGDICDSHTGAKREAWVEVQCTVADVGAGELLEMQKMEGCRTVFQMKSRHACAVSAISYGTVFLIIVFLGFSLYCVGGSLVRYKMYGKRGNDVIPHSQFWRQLPRLVSDGCDYSKEQLLGKKYADDDHGPI